MHGEVQEWLNWPLSKSGMAQAIEGSNPSLSAKIKDDHLVVFYLAWGLNPRVSTCRNDRGFGVASETKKCLHFFVSEWRSPLCGRYPSLSRGTRPNPSLFNPLLQ